MADFSFNIDDMFDPEKLMRSAADQISQGREPMKTSRMKNKRANPLSVTMFNLAEILMKVPAFDSPANVLARFESVIGGTIGTLYDELEDLPGIGNLIPKDVKAFLDPLNPDATGKEGSNQQESETPANGSPAPPDTSGVSAECRAIIKYVQDSGLPHRITSIYREGAVTAGSGRASNHSKKGTNGNSLAVDIFVPTRGARDTPELLAIFNSFFKVKSQLAELILSHPDARGRCISHGKEYYLKAGKTYDNHHDHVHVGAELGTFLVWPTPPPTTTTTNPVMRQL